VALGASKLGVSSLLGQKWNRVTSWFDLVDTNRAFLPQSGSFRAPVAGVYHVSCRAHITKIESGIQTIRLIVALNVVTSEQLDDLNSLRHLRAEASTTDVVHQDSVLPSKHRI
jgi:hypothetical protein